MNDDLLFITIASCPTVRRSSVVRNEAEQLFDALIEAHATLSDHCPFDSLLDRVDANRDEPLHLIKALAFVDLASAVVREDTKYLRDAVLSDPDLSSATRVHHRHRLRSACNAIERSDPPWCSDFSFDDWLRALSHSPQALGIVRRSVESAADAADVLRLAKSYFDSVAALFVALPRSVSLGDRELALFERLCVPDASLRAALLRHAGIESVSSWCDAVQCDAFLTLWHLLLRYGFDVPLVFADDALVVERVCSELRVSCDNLRFSEALLAWYASLLEREHGQRLLERSPQLVEAATRVIVACACHNVLSERRRMRCALRFCLLALRLRADERSLQFCFEQLTTTVGQLRSDEKLEAVAHLEILSDVLTGATDAASALGQQLGAVCVALFVIVDSLALTTDVIAVAPHVLIDRWLHAVAALWDNAGEHCFGEYDADVLDERIESLSKQLVECVGKHTSTVFECFTALSFQDRCLLPLLRAKVPLALCDVTQSACARLSNAVDSAAIESGRVAVNAAITMTSIVSAAAQASLAAVVALQPQAVGIMRRMVDVLSQLNVSALGLARASRLLEEWLDAQAQLCELFVARPEVTSPMWTDGMFRVWVEFVCGAGAAAFDGNSDDATRFATCVRNLARIVNAMQTAATAGSNAGVAAREPANAAALARVVNERLLGSRARLVMVLTSGVDDEVRRNCDEALALSETALKRMGSEMEWEKCNEQLEEVRKYEVEL
jgi:hypothetical protein